ncbi:hypothetical protein IMCC3317_12200 [Kordia antarctica]|uniref:Transglutaminase-like domain-containing protein n=2 Tax=Kordia antarctica TaxID=1218801 RepID=A0A7L4ZGV0_9FLAO|nr:hypothetical protein IMCC3317_12200 [Kordia antarctica]
MTFKLFKKFLATFLVLLSTNFIYGQHSSEYTNLKQKYPNANQVKLQEETTIEIQLKNGVVSITQSFLEEDIYLNESATMRSKRSLNFSSFFEMEKVEASSLNYINGKYREVEVKEFKEKDELDQSFHDDTKSLNFIYPNLKEGSKTYLNYSEKVKNPRFLSPFYFGGFSPIAHRKVTIIVDKDISLIFKEFNTEHVTINFTKKEKRGNIIYTWEINDVEEYDYESNVTTYKNILPHIVPIITSYIDENDAKVSLLGDVSNLYNWYYSLVKDINNEACDTKLVTIVNELTANKENDLEKVRAIYYWVQQNIKYIAFEYALGGFIPREANDVFQKKFGDCKDNSSILAIMLDVAGLKGNLTWIGTRSIPYSYKDVPTPIVDNHMILAYEYEGKTYFLDATGRYLPIEFPSSFIQGKEALIGNGENDFRIAEVPVIEAKKNAIIDASAIYIDGESIVGKGRSEISGYEKNYYFNYLESIKTDEKRTSFYNSLLQKGSNSFLIDKFEETNKYEYDKNFIVDYDFKITNYVKSIDDEIYVNLNLNKDLSSFKSKKDRKYEVKNTYKSHYEYQITFDIPAGYEVSYIPENIAIENPLISSAITYTRTKNQIKYNHNAEINYLSLSVEEQKKVNKLIKKIEKNYKEIIVLKKK